MEIATHLAGVGDEYATPPGTKIGGGILGLRVGEVGDFADATGAVDFVSFGHQSLPCASSVRASLRALARSKMATARDSRSATASSSSRGSRATK